ncbi:hypothetical protein ColLi_09096 [Colletotrichum liriopes]|uniref:Uncharacterized protein n=1 Tax=Colletotrichum liriopes TaxID=708192 RepID=A0AA37GUB4_9PEZI|nr:hypothetical protein ColLi_09096 [Colletotrichum liriopes]
MPLNDPTAHPTADTFHGMIIQRKMRIFWTAAENIISHAHPATHQLTFSSADYHRDKLHGKLGVNGFRDVKPYVDVVYPRIVTTLTARITALAGSYDHRPLVKCVVEARVARFVDAWTQPGWRGDIKKLRDVVEKRPAREDDNERENCRRRRYSGPTGRVGTHSPGFI